MNGYDNSKEDFWVLKVLRPKNLTYHKFGKWFSFKLSKANRLCNDSFGERVVSKKNDISEKWIQAMNSKFDLTKRIEIELNKRPRMAANLLTHRGVNYIIDGDFERGIADYILACKIDPLFAEWHLKTGMEYFTEGFYQEAIPYLTTAFELADPNDFDTIGNALYDRAMAFAEIGQFDKAFADCNKQIELGTKLNNIDLKNNGLELTKDIKNKLEFYKNKNK